MNQALSTLRRNFDTVRR